MLLVPLEVALVKFQLFFPKWHVLGGGRRRKGTNIPVSEKKSCAKAMVSSLGLICAITVCPKG